MALDLVVGAPPKIDKVATGFTFTEGPVFSRIGFLLFTDVRAEPPKILRWENGKVTTFREKSNRANGLTFDHQGRLLTCERDRVTRTEKDGSVTVLASAFEGSPLLSPNDLVYKSDGSLYFTDPPYGLATQSDSDPAKELQVNGVYRAPGARQQKPGAPPDRDKLQLVIKDLPRPNGVAFSPDEKFLYIADSGKKVWMRYRVQPDGSVTDGMVFLDPSSDPAKGVPDGMRLDKNGNIYSSGPGGVWIISPEGKHIGTVKVPEVVSNVAWGDKDGKTLYITGSTSIYRIKVSVEGDRRH